MERSSQAKERSISVRRLQTLDRKMNIRNMRWALKLLKDIISRENTGHPASGNIFKENGLLVKHYQIQ